MTDMYVYICIWRMILKSSMSSECQTLQLLLAPSWEPLKIKQVQQFNKQFVIGKRSMRFRNQNDEAKKLATRGHLHAMLTALTLA